MINKIKRNKRNKLVGKFAIKQTVLHFYLLDNILVQIRIDYTAKTLNVNTHLYDCMLSTERLKTN